MRSTHIGLLGGLIAVLLGLASSVALALEDLPAVTTATPGQSINLTARPTTFAVDRSPMAMQTNSVQKGFRATNMDRNIFYYLRKLGRNPSRIEVLDYLQTFLKTRSVPFEQFLGEQTQKDNLLRTTLNKIQNRISTSQDSAVFDQELLRLKAVLVYQQLLFAQESRPFTQEIFLRELQARWAGKQNAIAANFLHSSAKTRLDSSAQLLTGSHSGLGVVFNYDLVGFGFREDVTATTLAVLACDNYQLLAQRLVAIVENPTEQNQEDVRLAKYILTPHSGLSADYRIIDSIGNFYSVGLTFSILRPYRSWRDKEDIKAHNSRALLYSFGWRYHWFNANSSSNYRTTKGVGFNALIAWQNASPFLYRVEEGGQIVPRAQLDRWTRRFGFEYAQHNAVVTGDYVAFFGRLRDKRNMEYGFQVGSEINGQAFAGFSIGAYFK